MTTKTQPRTKFSAIKTGEKLSYTSYVTVLGKAKLNGVDAIQVEDQRGQKFTIAGASLIEDSFYSASQFHDTQTVSRTAIIELIETAGDTIFTVNFNKKVDPKVVADAVNLAVRTKSKFTESDAKTILLGEERTMVCVLTSLEPKMGRTQVTDLELNEGRQIDHRTINWLIIKGTKYISK